MKAEGRSVQFMDSDVMVASASASALPDAAPLADETRVASCRLSAAAAPALLLTLTIADTISSRVMLVRPAKLRRSQVPAGQSASSCGAGQGEGFGGGG
jgi:hypothetical protein